MPIEILARFLDLCYESPHQHKKKNEARAINKCVDLGPLSHFLFCKMVTYFEKSQLAKSNRNINFDQSCIFWIKCHCGIFAIVCQEGIIYFWQMHCSSRAKFDEKEAPTIHLILSQPFCIFPDVQPRERTEYLPHMWVVLVPIWLKILEGDTRRQIIRAYVLYLESEEDTTVLSAKSDSDAMFCLQLLSKHWLIHTTFANANR